MNTPRAPRWNPFRRTTRPTTGPTVAQAAVTDGRSASSAHARMAGDVIDATHHALLSEVDAHHERTLAEADAAIAYLEAETAAAEAQLAAHREAEDAAMEAERLAQQDADWAAADAADAASAADAVAFYGDLHPAHPEVTAQTAEAERVLPSMSQAVQDAVADLETHKGRPVTAPEVRWLAHVLADIDTAENPQPPTTRASVTADEAVPPPPSAAAEDVDEDGTSL